MNRSWREQGIPWVRCQMRRREWRQADLARHMDVPHGTISRWLTAGQSPDPEYCIRLADVFGANPDELLVMAGHRPAVFDEDDPLIREVIGVMRYLPLNDKREVVDYAHYRRGRSRART